uniref:Uncharacterized protein n=1 Tax=Meloidogyne incognita TaxID=6306 RepID=A0A914MED4_MELIC
MTTPYIGSKISLISQLDIRYEGFLHKVDPVESTISLSRVRSFGTEDRLANVTVPARKEVYDYIIFKASDIKDLIVCDTPKPTPDIDDITYDPAIISVSKPPANVPTEERKGTQDSEASSPQTQKYGAQIEPRQQQRDTSTNEKQLSGKFGQSARHQYYQQGTIQGQRQPYKYVNVRQAPPMPRVFQAQDHHITQQQRHYSGDHRPHHPHYYYNQGRNTRKYDGDFDFEKANEDFLESVDGVIENIAELDLESDLQSPPKVDPVESTISLSRVRSFGTEDRLANVTVPARKEVYDYIIFKASDIKDLIVCDTPKPTPDIDDITYDPAIISVSKPPANVPTEERKGTQDSEASSPQTQKYGAQIEPRQQQRDTSTNEKQLSGKFGQSARHQYYQQGTIQGQRQPYKYVNVRQAPPMPRVFQAQDHHITQQQRHYSGDHRPHHPHYYYNQGRNTRKYDGDFDFEKANEDFLESVDGVIENIAELDLESDLQSPPKDKSLTQEIDGETNGKAVAILEKSTKNNIYYDKSRSFFDNISCEATEREAGKDNRIDWKKERMTNEVTFGPAAVRMHNFHRRNSRGGAAPHLRRVGYFNNQQPRRYEAGPPENIRSGVFDKQNK